MSGTLTVDARQEPLSFRMLVLAADGTYEDRAPDQDGYLSSPVWSRRFRIDRSVDNAGDPTYRLVVRT